MKLRCKLLALVAIFAIATGVCKAQVENYCLRLSAGGSVDCGPMPELNGLSTYSVQFWFNAAQWTNGATLLSRGDGFSVKLGEANALNFKVGGQEFSIKRNNITANTWIPVTIIANGSRILVYISNTQVRSISSQAAMPETGSNFIIGGDNYNGRIDEVRVWKDELSSDYEFFTYTTLNKWAPQLADLVAYFKFDQPWCPNVVDYKPLFDTKQKTNHHGILSKTGAVREKVTDNNAGLPYLLMGGYTDIKRFYDSSIEADKYLLSNDLIVLGLQMYADGHVRPISLNDHGNARNAEYLESYKTKARSGVISFSGQGSYLSCPNTVFTNSNDYTIETWICVDVWNKDAFIFKKENAAATNGFSVRLGNEENREIIVRVDGREYFFTGTIQAGRWYHIAVMPGDANSNRNTITLYVSSKAFLADATRSNASTDHKPTGMNDLRAYIGLNLNGKLDDTMIWHKRLTVSDLEVHRKGNAPMPGPGKIVQKSEMDLASAYYRYDNPDNLGWDYYSLDEWRNIMANCYKGYTGFQIRVSVLGHSSWISSISNAANRKSYAADIVANSKYFDGIEFDLEWMDGTQTNLSLLADEVLALMPKGKTLMISQHQYGAYQYPKGKISTIDGFTFQQYGGQNTWYSLQNFKNGYNAFKNYGYPNDKIYLSYGTTTSSGYTASGAWAREIIGYNWGLIGSDYVPATDGSAERGMWNGNYFYFCGPVQVYNRAKFVRDNQLKGLFYWDICNDLSPSHKYSLSRNANYALNANVDPRVDEVEVNHPTAIKNVTYDNGPQSAANEQPAYDLSGRRIDPTKMRRGIIIQNGKKVIR